MANNSAGARSVLYGKTIDHVIEQHVVLSDGSLAHFRRARPAASSTQRAPATTLEAACYREVRRTAREHADEIERRYPKVSAGSAATTSTRYRRLRARRRAAVQPGEADGRLRGHARRRRRGKIALVPLPKAKAVLAIQFADLLEALEATPVDSRARPVGHRGDGSLHPRSHEAEPGARAAAADVHRGRSGGAAVRRVLRRPRRTTCRRGSTRSSGISRRAGFGYRYHRALDPAAQSADLVAPRGGARPVDGDEGRRQVALVCRGHGGRAREAARLHRAIPRDGPRPRHRRRRLRARVGRLPARAAGRQPEDRGRRPAVRGDRLGQRRSGARVRRRAVGRARRRPRPQPVHGADVRPGALRRVPAHQADVRPGRHLQSRQDRRRAAADRQPALRPGVSRRQPATFFDYSEHGGLAGAVEMCSGLGVCRKTLDGTMCPSYMATRDETHSTRGRANVLRLAMAGQLGDAGLGDEGVREVLDLCLECRACKTECPVGVDVARFKSEFLADYWRRHGTPLARARARTRARRVAVGQPVRAALERDRPQRAGALAERAAARPRSPPHAAGVDVASRSPRASLPVRPRRHGSAADLAPARVALFNDTFTNYYHPGDRHGGRSTSSSALGFDVALAPNRLLRPAADLAGSARRGRGARPRSTPTGCIRWPSAVAPLVFFEPSCLSAIREDAPSLLRGDAQRRARAVADRARALRGVPRSASARRDAHVSTLAAGRRAFCCTATAIRRRWAASRRRRRCSAAFPARRSSISTPAAAAWPDRSATSRDHFDVSRAIGERRLLPAARSVGAGAVLVASGMSCRHQIADFTGVRALHAAELLAVIRIHPGQRTADRE